jgi:predicted nicotinamide N-methyase
MLTVPGREEVFRHAECTIHVRFPRAADELIDEDAFARDERLPYWADLWPSSKALSRWVVEQHPPVGRAIELGCGLGLPSLVLASVGINVLATDWEPEALTWVQSNAHRNRIDSLNTALLDWRDAGASLQPFDIALGADLMYEQRNAIAVADLLPRLLKPGGAFILADPGRRWLPHFELLMTQRGWRSRELAQLNETQVLSTGIATSIVRIISFDAPSIP